MAIPDALVEKLHIFAVGSAASVDFWLFRRKSMNLSSRLYVLLFNNPSIASIWRTDISYLTHLSDIITPSIAEPSSADYSYSCGGLLLVAFIGNALCARGAITLLYAQLDNNGKITCKIENISRTRKASNDEEKLSKDITEIKFSPPSFRLSIGRGDKNHLFG